ncbi:NUDIX hydrolase domain [Trinorchestia longiramus]|nr:NUDIX hydrolase domain [Trinorchestia longiramus]
MLNWRVLIVRLVWTSLRISNVNKYKLSRLSSLQLQHHTTRQLSLLCGITFSIATCKKDGSIPYREVLPYLRKPQTFASVKPRNTDLKKDIRVTSFCSASSSFGNMSSPLKGNSSSCPFQGRRDRFNGVIVSSQLEPREVDDFAASLVASIETWRSEGVRGVWFEVHLTQAHWVPTLAKHGFVFHHGEDSEVVMVRWLPTDQPCSLPRYAHTVVGVGAMVVREDTEELLVVREKFHKMPHWKLPGGYVERGEDLSEAASREVLEETGVQAAFVGVVATRHSHAAVFSCSDFYFIVLMRPTSTDITMCSQELADCRWMKISEYAEHPLVHETNRFFVQCYLQAKEQGVSISATPLMSSVTRRQQIIYSVDCGAQNNHKSTAASHDCPGVTGKTTSVDGKDQTATDDSRGDRVSNGSSEVEAPGHFEVNRTDKSAGS